VEPVRVSELFGIGPSDEIAVNDAVVVRLREALADLERDVHAQLERDLPRLLEQRAQALPFEQLHHEVRAGRVGAAHVGDPHRVIVPHQARGSRFLLEPAVAALIDERFEG
jgi:hypothetical protein